MKDIMSFVVSPDSKEKAQSCIMAFGQPDAHQCDHQRRSKFEKPLYQLNAVGLSIPSPSPQNHRHQHNQQQQLTSHLRHNVDNARMSPNTAFLTHDSSCKRSDKAIFSFGHPISENISMPPPYMNLQQRQTGYHSDYFRQHCLPSNFAHLGMQQQPQVQRIYNNYSPYSSRRQNGIHDESRGAFDLHRCPADPNDEEVENILSSDYRQRWQMSWQNQLQIQEQQLLLYASQIPPMYHPQGFDFNFAPADPPQYQFYKNPTYQQFNDPLMPPGMDYPNEVFPVCNHNSYNHFNNLHSTPYNNPRKRKYGDESSSTTPRQDFYIILTDRPISPMSDISASPVPSFDEMEKLESEIKSQKPSFKQANLSPSRNLQGVSRSRKKLIIDTSLDESNIKHAEPKLPRRKATKFDWDEKATLRTVSPNKGKSEGDGDEKKDKIDCTGKIWRSSKKGDNSSDLALTNNISPSSTTEQGESNYIAQ